MRTQTARRSWPTAAVLLALSVGCADLVAPSGSTITLQVSPSTVAVDGDSAVIAAFVAESNGHAVRDGTVITFLTTNGGLCRPVAVSRGNSCRALQGRQPSTVLTTETRDGTARVTFRSGGTAGTATITARSGATSSTSTITISGLVAPEGTRLSATATPVQIAPGDTSRITAALIRSDGTPVVDNTRVRFEATAGTVSPSVALTQEGYASTRLFGVTAPNTVYVRIISGVVRDSVAITVLSPPGE